MALKYTRVRDKQTGHQYDVLAHKVDPEAHEPLNDPERWPDVSRPRPAKPNVLGKPKTETKAKAAAEKPGRSSRARAAKPAPADTEPVKTDGDPS